MNIAQVKREKERLSDMGARCVSENSDLIDQAMSEIRTVAYLLHPPMLDEMGLSSALPMYIEGFAQRSKVSVEFEAAHDLGRLPEDYELALFRIVQECLTNIHRHSGSSTATVMLSRTETEVRLEVRDRGKGIDDEMTKKIASGVGSGVGMRGMQERIKLMHGKMVVNSNPTGTSVVVTLPIAAR
jgi:two-component system, NarL family, sensor kinase